MRSARRSLQRLLLVAGALVLLLAATASHAGAQAGDLIDGTVSVSPSQGLKDGDTLTITWSGFPASKRVIATQCSRLEVTDVDQCNITTYKFGDSDANGAGSMTFKVTTGATGDGSCDDGANNSCSIYVSDTPTQTTVGFAAIKFGSAPTTTAAPATTAPASGGTATTKAGTATTQSPTTATTAAGDLADTGAASTLELTLIGSGLVILGFGLRMRAPRDTRALEGR